MKIHPLILVIDDESKKSDVFVCQSLEREGFDVASAGDGKKR